MKCVVTIHEPMYDFNEKKYIRFVIPEKVAEIIERMQTSRRHFQIMFSADESPLINKTPTDK